MIDRSEATARSLIHAGLVLIAVVAILSIAWYASATLLLIFAGILFGVFLDALNRQAGRILPIRHGLRLTLVCLLFFGGLAALLATGGMRIVQESADLGETIRQQIAVTREWLQGRGIDASFLSARPLPEGVARTGTIFSDPGALLPGSGSIASQALGLISTILGVVGNFLIIAFLGLFIAAQPMAYRSGILRFVPQRHRERAGETVDDIGGTLRRWLIGQLTTMTVIFVVTWAGLTVIGVPAAFLLALQAGLLAFIPNIGPVIAGIVIIVAALAVGPATALYAVGVYLLIQTLESYLLTPFIQRRALDIPPATLFAAQILLGVLFGLWGLALALPLVAVAKTVIDRLYLEDTLGEDVPKPGDV